MKENSTKCGGREPVRTCPICGKEYRQYPAISRKDNRTEICPDCGVLEALATFGCSREEQLHILDKIHSAKGGQLG